MSRKGSEKLAVHHFHPTSTPPTLPSHSLDIWGEVSHTKSREQRYLFCYLINHQIHEGHCVSQSSPIVPAVHSSCCHTTAIVSHNFLKGRSQWIATHHQTSQLPRFFWAWKDLRFLFQHKGGTMKNIPPIYLLHFLRWKCTSPEKFIIDPSDKARILASWVHPKVKHAIPEIQRNLFGVSNIRLGYWEITQKKRHHPGKIQSMFQEDSFPKTVLKVRSFQIPMSQSHRKVAVARNWTTYRPCYEKTKLRNTPIFVAELPRHFQRPVNLHRRTYFKPHFTRKKPTWLRFTFNLPKCNIKISHGFAVPRHRGEPEALRPLVIHSVHGAIPLQLLNTSVLMQVGTPFPVPFFVYFSTLYFTKMKKNMSAKYVAVGMKLKYLFGKDVLNLASFWAKNLKYS